MELYFNYKHSCSDVHELRFTTLVHTAICQSQRESGWARLTVNPSLPGGLWDRPVWLSVTQSWAQCGKSATTKWPTWAKWLYMCQWWAAVDKFKLEVTSNLKISTLNLKLAAATATSPCARSRPSPFRWTPVPTDSPARLWWRGRRSWSAWRLAPPSWGPNLRHTAAQVPWYRGTYHKIRDIILYMISCMIS